MLRASQKNINLDGRRGRKIRLWFIWFKEINQNFFFDNTPIKKSDQNAEYFLDEKSVTITTGFNGLK